MFERFTDLACGVIVWAERDASSLRHGHVGTEHLLLGVVHDGACVGGRAFSSLGVSYDDARAAVAARVTPVVRADRGQVVFTARAKESLELSFRVALQQAHTRIGTGDLTLALLRMPDSTALRVLDDLGVDRTIAGVRVGEMNSASARERPAQRGGVAAREFELSPQAQELLRRALRIGALYVAQRYVPAKLVSGASTSSRLMRELGTARGQGGPAEGPPLTADARDRGTNSGGALRVPPSTTPLSRAACVECGVGSPDCGTLYVRADGGLVCEHCLGTTSTMIAAPEPPTDT